MQEEAKHKKIMIVDDEMSLTSLLKSNLELEGYTVLTCTDAEKALQQASEFRPDLIVLDMMMPRLNGMDAIDLFKNTLATNNSVIIIYSALSEPENVEKAKQLGASDYIVKSNVPFEEVVGRIKATMASLN